MSAIRPSEFKASEQLLKMQKCMLDIMKAIDAVCREHGLKYYLADGTLIGAVRHHGFIPWDDDMDIAMPRNDYDIFIAHANEWLPDYYRLIEGRYDKHYPYEFARVHDIRTSYLLSRNFDYWSGVPVDIFPLDGMSDDMNVQNAHYKRFKKYQKQLYWTHINPYKHKYNIFRIAFLKLMRMVLDSAKIHRRMDEIQKEFDMAECHLVTHHNFIQSKGIWPKEAFGEPKEYDFEDCKFYGPTNPDPILRHVYGDYMSFPETVSDPNFRFLDLDHPNTDKTKPWTRFQ